MINELIKLANFLDESGFKKEAVAVDYIIKSADDGVDPDIDPSDISQAGLGWVYIPGLEELVAARILTSSQADKISAAGKKFVEEVLRRSGRLADMYAKVQKIPRANVAADVMKNLRFSHYNLLFLAATFVATEAVATGIFAQLGLLPKANGENIFWLPFSDRSHEIDWEYIKSVGEKMLKDEVERVLSEGSTPPKPKSTTSYETSPTMHRQLIMDTI